MKTARILLLTVISLCIPGTSIPDSLPERPNLKDDAYHFDAFHDGQHDENYIEWWYFNFYDENGIKGFITYAVTDPENESGMGAANVVAVFFTPEGTVQVNDVYPLADFDFAASSDTPHVEIAGCNSFFAEADNTFKVVGTSRDGFINWDLQFVPTTDPWLGYDKAQVGILPWMTMSWLVFMPGAEVSGILHFINSDGTDSSYALENVKGYHDHNWGEWIPAGPMWSWAQYHNPGGDGGDALVFDLGDIYNRNVGIIRIENAGEELIFTKNQFVISRSNWQFDAENTNFYPGTLTVHANNNKGQILIATIETMAVEPIIKMSPVPFLPDGIIYEQLAHFHVKLYKRQGFWWKKVLDDNGNGFAEHTVRNWQ